MDKIIKVESSFRVNNDDELMLGLRDLNGKILEASKRQGLETQLVLSAMLFVVLDICTDYLKSKLLAGAMVSEMSKTYASISMKNNSLTDKDREFLDNYRWENGL